MDYKQIRISIDLKDKLDDFRLHGESYNVAINRMLQEHESLKADKEALMKIALKTEDSIAFPTVRHSTFFAVMEVLKDKSSSDDDKLAFMKIYLKPSIAEDKEAVLSMIEAIKSDYGFSKDFINPSLLDKLSSWIRESNQ